MSDYFIKKYFSPILLICLLFFLPACSESPDGDETYRFEKDLFKYVEITQNSLDQLEEEYPEFLSLFCSDIIGIGTLETPDLAANLNLFISDPVISEIKGMVDSVYADFKTDANEIHKGIDRFENKLGREDTINIVTYISGFNQSFITLDGILGIGLDNYLGSETEFYQHLSIPKYVRKNMSPEYIIVDAVRAWIMSDIVPSQSLSSLLDNMIYEGKILWLLRESLPKIDEHEIFRYSSEQLDWCEQYEKSMWEYIIENELIYSNDRILISRVTKEAPFVREFGQDSPGRAGAWIGYKIIDEFMKRSGSKPQDLVNIEDARSILAESRYRPG